MEPALYYGVDVSKDTLHVAWAEGQGFGCLQVANQLPALEAWVESLPAQAHLVLEYTGTYSARLGWVATQAGRAFRLITPTQSKGFAHTLKSRSKTDARDAVMLARYGAALQPPATTLPEGALHQLRQQHGHLAALKTTAQALRNRLHALSYDPRACGKVQASLQALLESHQAQIALFEDELDTFSDDQLRAIAQRMQSVKGIGPASAQALSVATDGLRSFTSAKALACFVGVAPGQCQSGSSVQRRGRMARTSKGALRGVLYMAARSARRFNTACQDLYERLRRKGKCHRVAMVAVINKLLRQVFAVVKKGVEFDNHYPAAKLSLA